jgi:hypothetical protein
VVTEFPVIVLPLVSELDPPLWPARSGLRDIVGFHLPGFDQVRCCEECSEHNADAAYHDVGNTKEGIPASHDCASGKQDGLCSVINAYREVCELER